MNRHLFETLIRRLPSEEIIEGLAQKSIELYNSSYNNSSNQLSGYIETSTGSWLLPFDIHSIIFYAVKYYGSKKRYRISHTRAKVESRSTILYAVAAILKSATQKK